MKNYIVYDNQGKILRTGSCQKVNILKQAESDEFAMEGLANDMIQKIVDGKIVSKTAEEIEAEQPEPIPFELQYAPITNEQYQDLLSRIDKLEKKKKKDKKDKNL